MTTTTKRRPTVGDKVRLLLDLQPYKAGNIAFIMGDDHSYTPYYCKFADNSFHWLIERFVELVEPVEPIDPLADIKAAWAAGRRVRLILDIGVGPWHQRSEECASLSWAWPVGYYEVEPKPEPVPEPVQVDPYEHLRKAAKDGKRIRLKFRDGRCGNWMDGSVWFFDFPADHYEIEPDTVPIPEPVDPLADVKAALKAGKRVRCLQIDGTTGLWRTGALGWHFHLPRDHYEIEPDTVPVDPYEKFRQALREGRKVRIKSAGCPWPAHPLWTPDTPFYHTVDCYEIEPATAEKAKYKVLYEGPSDFLKVQDGPCSFIVLKEVKKILIIEVVE